MSDFNIGSKKWPGLSKLIEEAGEVQQVCGKLIATDGEIQHWDGSNLKVRLEEEIGDVLAACKFVERHCALDAGAIAIRRAQKLAMFVGWHEDGLRDAEIAELRKQLRAAGDRRDSDECARLEALIEMLVCE